MHPAVAAVTDEQAADQDSSRKDNAPGEFEFMELFTIVDSLFC